MRCICLDYGGRTKKYWYKIEDLCKLYSDGINDENKRFFCWDASTIGKKCETQCEICKKLKKRDNNTIIKELEEIFKFL